MSEGWRGVLWVATAAVVCGDLVASLLTGVPPHLGLIAVLIALAATVTIALHPVADEDGRPTTRLDRVRDAWGEARHRSSLHRDAERERREAERERRQQIDDARETVDTIGHALGPDDLEWLVSTDFTAPWRSEAADPYVELMLRVADLTDRGLDAELVQAADRLTLATASFVDFYAEHTLPDPTLRNDWRQVVRPSEGAVASKPSTARLRNARSERLRELSADLAAAYEGFMRVSHRGRGRIARHD